jgi:hypothetical protein
VLRQAFKRVRFDQAVATGVSFRAALPLLELAPQWARMEMVARVAAHLATCDAVKAARLPMAFRDAEAQAAEAQATEAQAAEALGRGPGGEGSVAVAAEEGDRIEGWVGGGGLRAGVEGSTAQPYRQLIEDLISLSITKVSAIRGAPLP